MRDVKERFLLNKTSLCFDIEKIRADFETISRKYPPSSAQEPERWDTPQIALVHDHLSHTPEEKVWGRNINLFGFKEDGKTRWDPDHYVHFNEEFKGLYLYEVYRRIREFSYLPIGRARFFSVPPNYAGPPHTDHDHCSGIRYHIAVRTNPGAYILYPRHRTMYHMPADGYVYKMNTNEVHAAVNGGEQTRYHLVFDTFGQDGPSSS